ncbi:MAG: hypothetical protein LBP62_03130 [Clostridiales bacterium]|jgi:NitT/TauT family transport system substrate-binding protein|nr:hypothetical protein [Clostridiales bacterium]
MRNTKKLFKTLLTAVFCLAAILSLASCELFNGWFKKPDIPDIKVYMPDGAPLLSLAKLRSDDPEIVKGYDVEYSTVANPSALAASLIAGEPDIAAAPINVCAAVYNMNKGYVLAGVGVWGIMHIVSNQSGTVTLDGLKGNTVLAFGKGETPGITLRAVLKQNDIKYTEEDASYTPEADEVNIVYANAVADVRNILASSGSIDGTAVKFALLAEPVATAITGATTGKDWGPYRAVINLQTEWAKNNGGGSFPQAGIVFKASLLKKHKKFIDKFIALVKDSAEFAENNPFEAGEIAKNRLGSTAIPNGKIVQTAVEAGRLPLNFVAANAAKINIETYLNVILAESPTLVHGKLPDGGFYY